MSHQVKKIKVWGCLLGLCILQILLIWPVLDLPPIGQHVWRQVTGLAFARNFAFDGASFFLPRQDIRVGALDQGIIYHEFPLVYWLVGKFYQIFGFQNFISRSVPFFINFMGIFAAYSLAKGLGYSRLRSFAFTIFYSFSGLYLYYTTTLLPDLTALNYFVAGVAFLLQFTKAQKHLGRAVLFILGVTFVMLALLTKPSWIFYGLPLGLVFFSNPIQERRFPRGKEILLVAGTGCLILGIFYWQYRYSQNLWDKAPLERSLHAQLKAAERPLNLTDLWRNLSTGLGTWFLEINVGWAAWIFFLAGIWLSCRRTAEIVFSTWFWRLYGLSFLIFGYFFVMRFGDHDYYWTASLLLAANLSSLGFSSMYERKGASRTVALVLLCAFPFLSFHRVRGRWFESKQVPSALLNSSDTFQKIIPKDDRVLVLGDSTPLVYLYYLDRKGISYLPGLTSNDLEALQNGDFRWLLMKDDGAIKIPNLMQEFYSLELRVRHENLSLYQISPKSFSQEKF